MADDDYSGGSESRSKKKGKFKRKKFFPFKHGGFNRARGENAVIKKD